MVAELCIDHQRIDKWLWFARFFKTRSLATKYVASGKIRLTRGDKTTRIVKASQCVQSGDVLTFVLHRDVRVLKVQDTGSRRGPAAEAQALYEDLAPVARTAPHLDDNGDATSAAQQRDGQRPAGHGRPTKKDRRALDALQRVAD